MRLVSAPFLKRASCFSALLLMVVFAGAKFGFNRHNLNPKKVNSLKANGIDVSEFKQTGVFTTTHNEKYLQAKVDIEAQLLAFIKRG